MMQMHSRQGRRSNADVAARVPTLFMSLCSSLQISMSVQMALSSVTANPLVSTCPAGTTASAATATMTTAYFPPMGNRV